MQESSFYISLNDTEKLFVKRFKADDTAIPVVLIHGSIENGRIFYSSSGKGLAPYLAQNGFDVFVIDLRGKGQSVPVIGKHSKFGQYECITEEFPKIFEQIYEKVLQPFHIMGHSWGGVLIASYLLRFPSEVSKVQTITFWGTKKQITVSGWEKFYSIDIMWNVVSRLFCKMYGFLPATQLGFGADNESDKFHKQCTAWVNSFQWKDEDGLDYNQLTAQMQWPPLFSIAAINDLYLGNPKDCQKLLQQMNAKNAHFMVLSKQNGNFEDYDHINMLTSRKAPDDHFKKVLQFLNTPKKFEM